MITNRWVFRDDWPATILHRDRELQQLSWLLEPALEGEPAGNALIYGPSGVGKTATSQFMIRQLRQRGDIASTTVACSGMSAHAIVHRLVCDHPTATAVRHNQPLEDQLTALREVVDKPYIVVLDEADTVPDLDILEDLVTIPNLSIIATAHDNTEWLSRIGSAAEHFHGESEVQYRRYDDEQLLDIVWPRVEEGLEVGAINDDRLEQIVRDAEGVARNAIWTLLAAAELAEERGRDQILDEDVDDAPARARTKIRKSNLESLPPVYQGVYELVRGFGDDVDADRLQEAYLEHAETIFEPSHRDPVTWRRIRDYLAKLHDYDLIDWKGSTSDRRYWAVDVDLDAPLEVDFNALKNKN